MAIPLIRQFDVAAPAALSTFAYATDDVTSLTFIRLSKPNAILDILNNPTPAAGLIYTVQLEKEAISTGRRFMSPSLNETSAGRVAIGPIPLSPANWYFNAQQNLGALTAYKFVVKFADGP